MRVKVIEMSVTKAAEVEVIHVENGARSHEPQNVSNLQKSGRARKQSLP